MVGIFVNLRNSSPALSYPAGTLLIKRRGEDDHVLSSFRSAFVMLFIISIPLFSFEW